MKSMIHTRIIFNEEFDQDEIISEFKKWIIEEHEKRIIKRGKLFEFLVSSSSIMFGNIHLLSGLDLNMGALHTKYIDTVRKCIEIAHSVCHEYKTQIEINPIPHATGSVVKVIRSR